jgi:hypothetical protein
MVLRQVGFAIVMETMEVAAAPQDLLWAMMMMSPLVMPFIWSILFGMHLVNSQETQVVCHQEHPCFEGHTRVGIVLEAMAAAAVEDLLCVMMMMTMPLVMPFIRGVLFGMRRVNSQETQVVCHQEHPCFEGHTRVGIVLEAMAVAAEDLLCAMMMMTMPLVMPFIWSILFGMCLVNSQETQVVCHQEHPCFEDHTRVGIVLEAMAAAAAEDLLCVMMMMTIPLVMPFIRGVLFGMRRMNLQETQVVCHQEHPCFEGHTRVGIVLEAMAVVAEDLLCAMMMMTMPLLMPFIRGVLFGMHLVSLQETQVVCHQEHPCFEGHTREGIVLEAMVAAEDLRCTMMMTTPLVMPFVRGILFGMHLVNLQETQVVCHQEHPCFKGHTRVGIVLEAMVVAEDLLCAMMMMTMPLVMPFIWSILFGMRLVNSQETQVVCHQEHPCFKGHTRVGIVLEVMAAAAAAEDLLCVMMMMTMPLVMPFIRDVVFGMRLVNSQETQVVCHQEHPCFEGHTRVGIVLEAMVAAEDLRCAMMMTTPLVMPFVRGILFGMHLVNSQESQVVCHQEHPCFKGNTRVGIVLEAMVVAEELLCAMMMMTMLLVMPFIWGILFGMHLVNSQETQVVCR